jgi:hypothetical protein
MIKRIILDILLFLFVIVCPWWLTVIFAVAILYYLRFFNEMVLFGLLMDIYYGSFSATFHIMDYKFTLLFFALLLTSFFIKKRLKFYNR